MCAHCAGTLVEADVLVATDVLVAAAVVVAAGSLLAAGLLVPAGLLVATLLLVAVVLVEGVRACRRGRVAGVAALCAAAGPLGYAGPDAATLMDSSGCVMAGLEERLRVRLATVVAGKATSSRRDSIFHFQRALDTMAVSMTPSTGPPVLLHPPAVNVDPPYPWGPLRQCL